MTYRKSDRGRLWLVGCGLALLSAGCSGASAPNDGPFDTSGDPSLATPDGGSVLAPNGNTDDAAIATPNGKGDAATPGPGALDGAVDAGPVPTGPTFPGVTDFAARGPYDTLNEAGGADCTIYRPTTLGDDGLKHPVLVWGNGTLANPSLYSGVLDHWASHGFIVAAANTSNAGTGMEMLACLDWVLAEDARAGSAYADHVDTTHAGASGHSQGGGGTIMAGRDARILATVPLEAYTQGLGHEAASQSQQQGPMFLLSGSADTIAPPDQNQAPVFAASNVPTFWGTLDGADHINSATGNISDFRGPATAWFRLHLMADESARTLFYGAACTLCSDAKWKVQKKQID